MPILFTRIPQVLFRPSKRIQQEQILAAFAKAATDAQSTTPVSLEVV